MYIYLYQSLASPRYLFPSAYSTRYCMLAFRPFFRSKRSILLLDSSQSPIRPSFPFVPTALLDEVRADTKLSSAADWDDPNKIRDGFLFRAPEEMIRIAAKWRVMPGAIIEKTAEMTNVSCISAAISSGFALLFDLRDSSQGVEYSRDLCQDPVLIRKEIC